MTDKQKKIMEKISKIVSCMTEQQSEQLLSYGEGMAFVARQRTPPAAQQPRPGA